MADDIYRAKSGFSAYHNGERISVCAGKTVRVGHWVLALYPDAFAPLVVDYDLPPEPAPVKRGPGRPPKNASEPTTES